MKKSTLALSVAAAIMGFAGNAMAISTLNQPATTATVVERNADGIGHQLVIPYFSTQNGNVTLLNITNTDQVNAKLVKVRFRGAANSDDIFDFTLALSPGDVWTASVGQDVTTGKSLLRTTDTSCVIPANVKSTSGQAFLTDRVDPTPAAGSKENETREGYVEIIQMADVPVPTLAIGSLALGKAYAAMTAAEKATTLYGQIKHVPNGAPLCDDTTLNTLIGTDFATVAAANTNGLTQTSGGLTADWVIMNQTTTAAWSGSALAFEARLVAGGAPALGNIAFWPQKSGTPIQFTSTGATLAELGRNDFTADPIFVSNTVAIQQFDLPDLSTAYTTVDNALANVANNAVSAGTGGAAQNRADLLSAQLAVKSITTPFVTNSGIAGATDIVFSQPTRRFSVGVNYKAAAVAPATTVGNNVTTTTGALASAVFRAPVGNWTAAATGSAYYDTTDLTLTGRQACLNNLTKNTYYDREENTPTTPQSAFVISPGILTTTQAIPVCGEDAIVSINGATGGSALSASVAKTNLTTNTGYDLGYFVISTNRNNAVGGANLGLPIAGFTASRVANGAVNYGFTSQHKVTR